MDEIRELQKRIKELEDKLGTASGEARKNLEAQLAQLRDELSQKLDARATSFSGI